jgi:hypothetical protein
MSSQQYGCFDVVPYAQDLKICDCPNISFQGAATTGGISIGPLDTEDGLDQRIDTIIVSGSVPLFSPDKSRFEENARKFQDIWLHFVVDMTDRSIL